MALAVAAGEVSADGLRAGSGFDGVLPGRQTGRGAQGFQSPAQRPQQSSSAAGGAGGGAIHFARLVAQRQHGRGAWRRAVLAGSTGVPAGRNLAADGAGGQRFL